MGYRVVRLVLTLISSIVDLRFLLHDTMRKLTLPSRYTILLAILLVLFIQLILWFVVVFRPQSSITIYLEQLDVQHNQLEFQNAIMGQHANNDRQEHFDLQNAVIDQEREDTNRKAWYARRGDSNSHGHGSLNKTHDREYLHARHKRSRILARLEVIKLEKMDQQLGGKHEAHGLHNNRTEKNAETNPLLQERAALIASSWSEETRQRLLHHLQPSLFTQNLAPLSDSSCDLVDIQAPEQLCRHHYEWECRHSHTFTQHFRHNRTLRINCPGDLRIDWYFERDGGLTSDVMKNYTNQYSEWSHVTGPIDIYFPTQYADVMCRVKTDNGTEIHHNYRTQFIPNIEAVKTQRKILDQLKSHQPTWQPLSILSINVDSLSRAQFHRQCGLPKTTQLLTNLFNANNRSSHQAFLFNRLNAIGGVTAMNLTPLYAGIFFRKADEEKRVLHHRYTKPIQEWMWDYANEHGYLTSYAMDTGNGLMGTRTICPTCNHLPVELPHWEHGWVHRENEEVRPGVLSGLCDGDTMVHEHIINFTQDFLTHSHPATWAAFDLNAKHRPEQESANQVDALLAHTLQTLMQSLPNLAIFLFGDHGDRYHGDAANHPGSYMEIMLPFLAIVLPRHIFESHPEWERNLLINSQRYVVHYDVHHTMKSLIHYPAMDQVKGHIFDDSYNLITQIIPRERVCADAKIPHWSCACGGPTYLEPHQWTDTHVYYAELALDDINARHSMAVLAGEAAAEEQFSTTCMDLHLDSLVTVARIEYDYAGLQVVMYLLTFRAREGPSLWDLRITEQGRIESLKQVTRYQKYKTCLDPRVSIEFCVCKQFPHGTP